MATLTSTITEAVTINGKSLGNTITNSVTSVNNVYQTVISVKTASPVNIITFGASGSEAMGTIDDGDMKYLRVTNIDATNFVNLTFAVSSDSSKLKLAAGDSFVYFLDQADTGGGSIAQLDSIKAQADTAECKVEVFIGY
tara:strand:+ start:2398 stop:2817 length:420 start_codon:yes stop_codon:yes gene_type:complete